MNPLVRRWKSIVACVSGAAAVAGVIYGLGAHAAEQTARIEHVESKTNDVDVQAKDIVRSLRRIEYRQARLDGMVESLLRSQGLQLPTLAATLIEPTTDNSTAP